MKKPVTRLQQIFFERSEGEDFGHPANVDPSVRKALVETFHADLLQGSPAHTWPGTSSLTCCPHPIVLTQAHQRQLQALNDALYLAISDIVERWWIDADARFPERMPVGDAEEKLLRSMAKLDTRPFKTCSGSWRPDFLLEPSQEDPDGIENYRVCEINARFCWNGFFHSYWVQQSLLNMGIERNGLRGATIPEQTIDGLKQLFDPTIPLHLVKGRELGFDIHMFIYYAEQRLGMQLRMVHQDDLRLVPCESSPTGYKLCCLAGDTKGQTFTSKSGETLEEIHQLNIELHQDELMSLSFEMQQEIGLRCFNSLRTILLVHDKRMLGLVLEELDSLVTRNVLTAEQAHILDCGIVPTIIPGSAKLGQYIARCAENPSLKDEYILKPVRGGKGAGILFGDLLSTDEWSLKLEALRSPNLAADSSTYVVQRRIYQNTYDVLLREDDGVKELPLIGTFHMVQGQYLGFGIWRSGPGRVCALSRGGAWLGSVLQDGSS
ncbi:hypothetical protein BDV18DRAFT_136995 [Aspergillus unguis]